MHKCRWQILTHLFVLVFILSTAGGAAARDKIHLTMPDLDWALEIDCPTFEIQKGDFNPDGPSWRLMAKDQRTEVIMSIFVEPAAGDGDYKACRDYYWPLVESSPVIEENIIFSERGEMAIVEYIIKRFRGLKINQKNFNVYMARDGFWIDIHLSKLYYRESDQRQFEKVLDGIRIIDDYNQTATDNFLFGSYFYLKNDLEKAIAYYEKALKCHPSDSLPERNLWRVTVDNLAMAYGLNGDLANSERVLLEGIQQDPSYPMFYYNIACTYAGMGEKANAIANLRKAYERRANMIVGEEFPDPRKDPSFKLLLNDPAFVTVLTDHER